MILVIGEALIDLIENRYQPGSFNAIVGGANANVAIALARRGSAHSFAGRVSTDAFGQQIIKKLEDNGVDLTHTIRTDDPTTLAVVSINEKGSPTYSFYVNGTADWGWTPDELPATDAKAIQFGCLTMAMEPGNRVIEAWARAQADTKTISHDVNLRPALGFEVASEQVRVERINEFSHLIKASDEDLGWLYPGESYDAVATRWSRGKLVLVTRGAEGTDVYRDGTHLFNVPSRKINVVDTVGAGDTFCANLLGQLLEGDHLGLGDGSSPAEKLLTLDAEVLRGYVHVAGVAASITCERPGCEPPTLEDLAGAVPTV